MHYIKCTGCGKFNTIKSEYQIFCEHCNAKLANNFTLWKKRNPKGTFEEFQEKECISNALKSQQENVMHQSKKKKANPVLLLLGLLLLIFLGIGVTGYFLKPYIVGYASAFLEKNQNAIFSKLNDQEWETYSCGHLGLSVESPSPMVEDKQQIIPEQYKQVMQEMSVFAMENPLLKLQISANSIQYAQGVQTSLEGAKDGVLNQLSQSLGNLQLNTTDTPYEINNISGILTTGGMDLGDAPLGIKLLSLMDGLNLWQVMVVYDSSGENAGIMADKIIQSVKIARL